jgi:hypothetical protein
LQAILDLKNESFLEASSSFYPHSSCAESALFSDGSYGSMIRSARRKAKFSPKARSTERSPR